jgi:hypothetical protein
MAQRSDGGRWLELIVSAQDAIPIAGKPLSGSFSLSSIRQSAKTADRPIVLNDPTVSSDRGPRDGLGKRFFLRKTRESHRNELVFYPSLQCFLTLLGLPSFFQMLPQKHLTWCHILSQLSGKLFQMRFIGDKVRGPNPLLGGVPVGRGGFRCLHHLLPIESIIQ